ncbi:hypothetical protein [Stackebrandtia albiflava]|uniref:hypothetical protein n=1 Tax=Stackebrandtia albiflava TaxID=406432 RepID=UPI0011BE0FFA|nr:hypothetical protein [Stackebrandtia albiflava]
MTAPAGERRQVADVLAAVRAAVPGDVDVQLVDPRNSLYLLPTVYRAARRNGTGPLAACRVAVLATTPWTLIVDGRILSRSRPLTPATARTLLTPECDGSRQPRDAPNDGPRVA